MGGDPIRQTCQGLVASYVQCGHPLSGDGHSGIQNEATEARAREVKEDSLDRGL